MNLKELRQQLAAKKQRGKAALAERTALAGVAAPTAEQTAQIAALDEELDTLEAAVEDLAGKLATEEARARRAGLFSADPVFSGLVPARSAGRTVAEPNPETTFGFKSLVEMANAVRRQVAGGQVDNRLAAAIEMTNPTNFEQNNGSGGDGFLVPPDFSRSVWEMAFEQTDLLGMCAPEPTASNSVFKPKDETTPWGAVGVQAVWASEAQTLTSTKLSITGDLMMLHKLYAFTAASEEVLQDAPMLNDRLTRQASRAIKWKASDAIIWGNGVGQPLGFMKAPSLITVNKESGQAAATVVILNLLKMASRMIRLGGRPLWIINPDVLPQLGQLTLGNVPAWLPNNQPLVSDPFEGTLLGYPVLFSEHAQTLGTSGDITLANLDGYYAATKVGGGMDFASSMHLYFDTGLTAFRWTFRIAGQPYLSAPYAAANGATTKSHFIALQNR